MWRERYPRRETEIIPLAYSNQELFLQIRKKLTVCFLRCILAFAFEYLDSNNDQTYTILSFLTSVLFQSFADETLFNIPVNESALT